MWSYNNTNELYHYGVKGMKWGVRRSPEVQAVNKAYKKELRGLKRERNKQNFETEIGSSVGGMFLGKTYGNTKRAIGRDINRKEYQDKKRQLQEKYEPDFQKAKETAEKRLSEQAKQSAAKKLESNTKMSDVSPKSTSTGKKVALGVLAGVGGLAVGAAAAYVSANMQIKKESNLSIVDWVKLYNAARKL